MSHTHKVAYTPRKEFNCGFSEGSTHYKGCQCHEATWAATLQEAHEEIERLRYTHKQLTAIIALRHEQHAQSEARRETLRAARKEALYQLERIKTADWGVEQMRFGAKSGAYQVKQALAADSKENEK